MTNFYVYRFDNERGEYVFERKSSDKTLSIEDALGSDESSPMAVILALPEEVILPMNVVGKSLGQAYDAIFKSLPLKPAE